LNREKGLKVFLEQPKIKIHNNDMERAIRGPVIGRKNHHASVNIDTAQMAAIWYSIIETCKASNVPPEAYVNYAMQTILRGGKPKMPWEFIQNQ
jgi:transposase